ncbi:secretion/DNA translocation related CpaE-like protein [Nocardioides zeae]|uniref:Secretion/DNA translocation related CpaE-like protein n=1 Tax=Nocardioides zeae TaxID=1457234 RepID=A0ACC6IN10_9ACTN|nr:septum site-determining protein Ssd [Nocardioides zeae]MDR6174765.1 secretion/DNA translocation related CpaE-like protein [Nocardioides zeae]MDR6212033.1 secretion/DNA translocation related CpaE-like protein [Nocardioides zeae]
MRRRRPGPTAADLRAAPPPPTRPVLVTRAAALAARVERLAAASGTSLHVTAGATEALAAWRRAPLVLVGQDVAVELAERRPARRAEVHVVASAEVGQEVLRAALGLGAEGVVVLPDGEAWLGELLAAQEAVPHAARTVAVAGATGGAGATTLACLLGLLAAEDAPALVVDLDPAGAGVDRVLGLEAVGGIRWSALDDVVGRLSGPALRDALPGRGGLRVLAWDDAGRGTGGGRGRADRPLPHPAVLAEVLAAAAKAHATVVVDVGRREDAVADDVLARSDLAVVVVPGTAPGLVAAGLRVDGLGARVPVGVVLRGRAADEAVVAGAVGAPVVARLPERRRAVEDVHLGIGGLRPSRGLVRAGRDVLALLSEHAPRWSAGGAA